MSLYGKCNGTYVLIYRQFFPANHTASKDFWPFSSRFSDCFSDFFAGRFIIFSFHSWRRFAVSECSPVRDVIVASKRMYDDDDDVIK